MTNLKLWRLTNNLTQSDAARRCGLGLSAYCLIEAGRLRPSLVQADKLAAVFGARAADMLLRIPAVPQ